MMDAQENIKVYELAKELGVDSLSLIDQLRDLDIQVKSHMSELPCEQADRARSVLVKKTSSQKSAEGAAPKAPKAAPKKRVTKSSPFPALASTDSPTEPKRASAPVIRRRATLEPAAPPPPEPPKSVVETSVTPTVETVDSPIGEVESPSAISVLAEPASEPAVIEPVLNSTPEKAPETIPPIVVQDAPPPPAFVKTAPLPPEAPQKPVLASPKVISPTGETKIIKPNTSGLLKIVRSDDGVNRRKPLLRIQSMPTVAPVQPARLPISPKGFSPTGTPGIPGPLDKGPGRQFNGLGSKQPHRGTDDEEAALASKKLGGPREEEPRPEDLKFDDYLKKKEMVFLPKRKKIPLGKQLKKTAITKPKEHKRIVEFHGSITVSDLSNQLQVKSSEIVRKLMNLGQMANMNTVLDFDAAQLIASEYQYEVKNVAFQENEILIDKTADSVESLKSRPPIVTVMGHVDHGKTSLLDAIRESDVAAHESGGITQHVGAYTVEKNGKLITFIDTPGHEAFSMMRARGANLTDIVILVVAADDGVMAQTREALSHAKASGSPIIVAINKMDKPGANPDKIKKALAELNLLSEDWGGQTMFVPVSAVKKTGIDELLEAILLQSEVLDLKSNPDARGSGVVLEAKMEKGRGPVCHLICKRGTISPGHTIVAGTTFGRVRAIIDDKGRAVSKLTPGLAAEVLGLDGLPGAGDDFQVVQSESDAKKVIQNRLDAARALSASQNTKMSLEALFAKVQAGEAKELNVILKSDVVGSLEAIRDSLLKLSTEKVRVKILFSAPGGISESDVHLANASNAIIIGFKVRPETNARQLAESQHIEVKTYDVIYELIDDVKKAMVGILDKKKVEVFLGRAEIRQTFSVPKFGVIAGSAVIDGKILRNAQVRLLRDSRIIFDGKLGSLKRFKDDAREVAQGFECGMSLEGFNDLKPGDVIEAYQIELITPEL